MSKLHIYNTLSRKKEEFKPIEEGRVGMYVCGPTVYGDAHLGHARPAITFDLLYRYLLHLDYKVRYIRNITDVGHLIGDADDGEDKIAKRAKIDKLEPMEVAQHYTNTYHDSMRLLKVLPPSIEPLATGHIIEQIELIKALIDKGFAYESEGSVYFDVQQYAETHDYGALSGRKIEDLLANTRELDGQSEKRSSLDFAIWKKASDEHIMRWSSPWSEGFPGWHTECTAMGCKYLGETFDIHGGGMDLQFPHHEAEIAQAVASKGKSPVNYWMHNNMVTIGGQKMGKSLGNFINLDEFFSGSHELLEQAYSPMTIRFFMLQAHYRSQLDFSNEALQASEKGLAKLFAALKDVSGLKTSKSSDINAEELKNKCYEALNDDLNSPILIANLFDIVRIVNSIKDGKLSIDDKNKASLSNILSTFVIDILGLDSSDSSSTNNSAYQDAIDLLLEIRQKAKDNKDWTTSDLIRDKLQEFGFTIKDTKDGAEWSLQ
ncbi:MAG: cysteine--tRNA ligase [Bacteroidales bacterium]